MMDHDHDHETLKIVLDTIDALQKSIESLKERVNRLEDEARDRQEEVEK